MKSQLIWATRSLLLMTLSTILCQAGGQAPAPVAPAPVAPIQAPQAAPAQPSAQDALKEAKEKLADAAREYSVALNNLDSTIHDIATPAKHRKMKKHR